MKFFPLLHVKVLGRRVGQLLESRFAPVGLTDTKAKILGALAHRPDLTARDLLPWTEIEPASLTEVLQSLERDGLIERKPHPKDRRSIQLSLTDAGYAAQRRSLEALEAAHEDLFSVFTPAEAEEYERLSKLLSERLEELGIGCRGGGQQGKKGSEASES